MNIKKKHLIADLGLFLVAIIWGSGFTASKIALDSGLGPYYMMGFRFLIATIIMGVIFFKKLTQITKQDIIYSSIVGIALFFAFATQTVGLQFTTASKNAFLTGTNVVMVPFIFWGIAKIKPDKWSLLAAITCLLGIGFLSFDGSFTLGLGDSLSLLCAFGFACHISLTGYFGKKIDSTILTFIQMLVSALLSFIFGFFFEELPTNPSTAGITAVIYLGVFSTMIAFFLQTIAQKYTTASRTAIILSTEALFGTLFSVILLGEILTFRMIVGAIAIFFAIITAETKWKFLFKEKVISK